ncbi:hypothetical protein [Glaciibacter sp. 2TAF33]|uniref:hypothetical protein n=1 Tax=Glaciibacter sp. 2TAF33 TaxID=3233015 RepID=UPI003F8F2B76
MFGRRRRVAPVVQAPAPELSDEHIFELLNSKLAEIVGARGSWTLVPRSSDDTDVIFHDLKSTQIATVLATLLKTEKATLRGETAAEPTALPWTPAPITVWAEPEHASVNAPVRIPAYQAAGEPERARLVA